MPARHETQKVICYIVRDGRLLVFKHLDHPWEVTGLQVPAGSIKSGESPEEAALREAVEETGLRAIRVVRKLGTTTYDLAPVRPEVQVRHVFHLEPDDEPPVRWTSHEADSDDGTGIHRFECFWIPLAQGHALAAGQGALLGRLAPD